MQGRVIKSTGSWYTVESPDGIAVTCKIRGAFRLQESDSTSPVVVGDQVVFEITDSGNGQISEVLKRKNYIIRKSTNLSKQSQILAANIDRAFLVVTLVQPRTSTGFIDRYLVTAEAYSVPVTLVFNKSDLYNEDDLQYQQALGKLYAELGYGIVCMSARNPADVQLLRSQMEPGVNLFSGHSGVGKSTLLNGLNPALGLKTGAISVQHEKGTHTTTFAEMHKLSNDIYIVDTPGIRDFGMYDLTKQEVSHYFPEMRLLLNHCRFDNCMHLNEPGCAVKKAIDEDRIAYSRYQSYISILNGDDSYK